MQGSSLEREHLLNDAGSTDVVSVLKGLLKYHIKIEFTYYKLVNDMDMFKCKWAVNHCICDVNVDECLLFYISVCVFVYIYFYIQKCK